MKKVLLAVTALLLVAGSSFAQSPDTAYVGLFTDVNHTTWNVSLVTTPTPFYMYIFWLPTDAGMRAAQWAISYPSDDIVTAATVTSDADITVTMGNLVDGIAISVGTCHPGGVWYQTHRQRIFLYTADVAAFEIIANPTTIPPSYKMSSCELGYPKYPVIRYTNLCVNSTCTTATQGKTWERSRASSRPRCLEKRNPWKGRLPESAL